ncbi:putative transcriptional regulatory protein [Podospora australis]|uniref:Transcriptional regulatory protein n=1 Tax=Podospora australis TaxID=1536484 RepID=A0AAN6WMT7_9PEZI|nr:putative transcriptional regulatory protein [Podospora australis]
MSDHSPPPDSHSIVPRACNACRVRKIGCNRESPCAHCLRAKIECTYTEFKPREKRARILLSHQYEQKIDQLDSRLDEVIGLLKELKTQNVSSTRPPETRVPERPRHQSSSARLLPSTTPSPSMNTPSTSAAATCTSHPTMVEGDSSMTAQSVFANDFMQKMTTTTIQPEMRDKLNALQVMVDGMKKQPASYEMTYPNARPVKPMTFEGCELPPIDRTLQILKLAQSPQYSSLLGLAWVYEFLPMNRFQEICFRTYMADDRNNVDFITVNVGLHFLFWAGAQLSPDPNTGEEWMDLSRSCGVNLETALSSLPLHLPASDEVIGALTIGTFYAVEISKPSLAWILCSKASELCQTLGYHRISSHRNDTAENAVYRQFLFWVVYIVDKNLSLRLGRCSTIHDYDITVPYPAADDVGTSGIKHFFTLWIMSSKVQGQVYELLYCPKALSESEEVRKFRVQLLSRSLDEVEVRTNDIIEQYGKSAQHHIDIEPYTPELYEFCILSDSVLRLSILTLIHRAVPNPAGSPTTFSVECIQAARQTLARHQDCMAIVERSNCGLFSTYMHWTILMAPFVPFIVIFCHVIETKDREDLARLQAFVTSLQLESSVTEAVEKLRRLFQVLYSVASFYIEEAGQQPRMMMGLSSTTGGFQAIPLFSSSSSSENNHDNHHVHQRASVSAAAAGVGPIVDVDAYLATLGFPFQASSLSGPETAAPTTEWQQQQHTTDGTGRPADADVRDGQQTTGDTTAVSSAPQDFQQLRSTNPMMWMGNGMELQDWLYNNEQMMTLLDGNFTS